MNETITTNNKNWQPKRWIAALLSLIFAANTYAQDSLSDRLKQIDESMHQESKIILVKAAELVGLMDYMQLHGIAAVAAEHKQWRQAGFYFIAAAMRRKVDAYVYDLIKPEAVEEIIKSHSNALQVRKLAYEMYKDPVFKKVMDRNQKDGDLIQNNQQIKLYMISHLDVLKIAIDWYTLWRPTYGDSYVPSLPSKARLTPAEADMTFEQYNEVYLQSNQDILKLMEVPEYQTLMVEKEQAYIDWSSKLFKTGKVDKDKIRVDKMNQRNRAIERIEMEELLFPEKDWGWFR